VDYSTSDEGDDAMKKTAFIILLLCLPVFAWADPFGYTVTNFTNQSQQVESHLMRIDLSTGISSDLGAIDFHTAQGLAFAKNQLYAMGGIPGTGNADFWNLTTPPGSLISATGNNLSNTGLDYDRTTETMYQITAFWQGIEFYSIDIGAGTSTYIYGRAFFMDTMTLDGLAINSQVEIYAAGFGWTNSLYRIDLSEADIFIPVGPLLGTPMQGHCGLAFDESDTLWALRSDGSIYTVNTNTGAATFIAQTVANEGGLAINPVATPEPTTMLLLGLGLVVVAGFRNRIGM